MIASRPFSAINRLSKYTKNPTAFLPISTTDDEFFLSLRKSGKMVRSHTVEAALLACLNRARRFLCTYTLFRLRSLSDSHRASLAHEWSWGCVGAILRVYWCDLTTHAQCRLLMKTIWMHTSTLHDTGAMCEKRRKRQQRFHWAYTARRKILKKMFLVGRSRSNFYTFGKIMQNSPVT